MEKLKKNSILKIKVFVCKKICVEVEQYIVSCEWGYCIMGHMKIAP